METKNIVCTAELKCGHSREIEFPREASIQEACEIVDMLRHINCSSCQPEGVEADCAQS